MIREYREALQERELTAEERKQLERRLDQMIGGVKSGSDQEPTGVDPYGSIDESEGNISCHAN